MTSIEVLVYPEVQRAYWSVTQLLLGDAGEEEARRTILAVMIAAIGDAAVE